MTSDPEHARGNFLRLNAAPSASHADADGIHIAGMTFHTRPENLQCVRAELERLSGAEVHAANPRAERDHATVLANGE